VPTDGALVVDLGLDAQAPDAQALDASLAALDAAVPDDLGGISDMTVPPDGFVCRGLESERPEGQLRVSGCRLRRGGLDAPPRGVVVAEESLLREARTPLHEAADYERLAAAGFDLVWLLVTWEGIEPLRDTYNGAYLGRVCAQVDLAHAAGLEVVLGMHQTCWGPAIGGQGMPAWATPPGLAMSDDPQCDHPSVAAAWVAFWADQSPALVAAWGRLLDTCADRAGVVGIQPLSGTMLSTASDAYRAFSDAVEAAAEARLGPLLVFHPPWFASGAPDHLRTGSIGLPDSFGSTGLYTRAVAGLDGDQLRAARAQSTQNGAGAAVWIDGFGTGPYALRDADGAPGPLWAVATEGPWPLAVAGSLIGWGPEAGAWTARWWADGRNEGVSRFQLAGDAPDPVVRLNPDGPFTWFSGYDRATGELTVFVDGAVGQVSLTVEVQ
jgi:hypothetical protein